MALTTEELNKFYEEMTNHRNEIVIENEKEYYKQLQKQYGLTEEALLALLVPFFNRFSDSKGILYQDQLMAKNRLKTLQSDMAKILKETYEKEKEMINPQLKDWIDDEYAYQSFVISQYQPDMKVRKLKQADIEKILKENWAGELFTASLLNKKIEMANQLSKDLIRGSVDGLTEKEMKGYIQQRVKSGLNHSLLVYQNELSRKKSTVSDVVSEYYTTDDPVLLFVCSLDDRACDKCSPLDNVRKRKSKWMVSPPIHVRCRCRFVEIVPGWEQTIRTGRDLATYQSYVTSAKNFKQWKKEQGL